MDNRKEMQKYQEQLKEIFAVSVSDKLCNTWADTFEIDNVDEKEVTIVYHGSKRFRKFKKECGATLQFCIYSIFGDRVKLRIVKNKKHVVSDTKLKKNIKAAKFFVVGMIFVCIATAVIVVLFNYVGNRNFRETFYSASSIKVDSNVRVIQLSDLHSVSYGENNEKLIERVRVLNPDIIICTGDMVNSAKDDVDFAVSLGKELSEIAPSYYVYGNNEVESIYDFPLNEKELDEKFGFDKNSRDETALLKLEDSFEEKLENTGIKVLKNEKDTITVKTMTIDIYGVLNSNPSSFWSYSENAFTDYVGTTADNLKIMAVHEPFVFEEFAPNFWGDLMICGHTHGGVVRVPILGPLFTHEGGLFPERDGAFVYGRYDAQGKPLIVSGGLENTNVFRMNNQPELVVIDINKF